VILAVCALTVRFADSHPGMRGASPAGNAQLVLLSFLPFFHIYGLMVTAFMSLAVGALVVTLPRFSLREMLGCIEKHKASERL